MGKFAITTKHTALITGGSSGIGLAAAMELARLDYELLICARDQEKLDAAATQIKAAGGAVYCKICDVSTAEDVAALADHAAELWDHIDLLFNNAGSGQAVSLADTTDDLWDATIEANLTGTFRCCRAFMPMLLRASAPIIINNASVAAHRGFSNFSAYSAAKGGVAALSRAIREEFRDRGLRVTTLYIGATDSPFWDGVEGEWDRARMMHCEDIGRLVSFIASNNPCAAMEEIHLMPTGGAL